MASHTPTTSRPGRTYSEPAHREAVKQIRTWMRENGVTNAGQVPYSASLTSDDGSPILIGRRIARARKNHAQGKLPRNIVSLYERLPGWSWTATRPRPKYSRARTAELPAKLLRWMQENDVAAAGEVPYSAILEIDGKHERVGRAMDWVRQRYNAGELPVEVAELFEQLPGWTWTPPRQRAPGRQRSPHSPTASR